MAAAGSERRILIVEDDVDVRDALVQVLEFEGYRVTSATNGAEALAELRAGAPPGLILLDLMMPVMDGRQFRVAQLADPALARIPVVVLSADGGVEQKATTMGAAAYLKKPIEVDSLLDVVARFG
jgi:CheY-like chemotaxis protein